MKLTLEDRRIVRRALVPLLLAQALVAAVVVALFVPTVREPVYDVMAAGRKPLVIVNGQTQQLQTTDWISTVGGLTTNATAPAAGDVQTTTLTASGLSTLTGGFALGADSSAASHKITNLTNGASAQDAAAFGQIATAVNAAVSGTSGRSCRFSGTNAVGNGAFSDDGTNATANGTLTSIVGANTFGEERGNVTSPAALAANQNDYAGCNSNTRICQISATSATRQLTGMTGGAAGRILTLANTGASISVQLNNEDSGSAAANRFKLPGAQNWTIPGGCSSTFIYDGTDSRWRLMAFACNTLPTTTVSGTLIVTSGTVLSGYVQFAGTATTGTITGTNNNVNPTGQASATTLYLTPNAAGTTVTGIVQSGNDGRLLIVYNSSPTYDVTLLHQDAGSTASNRFTFPNSQNVTIPPASSVLLRYDGGGGITAWKLGVSQAPIVGRLNAIGADPALSSCGTSPSVIGNDTVGTVTIGTGGSATSCTITFDRPFVTNAPACQLTSHMSARTDLYISAASTTAITVSNGAGAAWPASGQFTYHCTGTP